MPYTMKIDLDGQDEVSVDGLGTFKDGVTYSITDQQAAIFEAMHGAPITECFVASAGDARAGDERVTIEEVASSDAPPPITQLELSFGEATELEDMSNAQLDKLLQARDLPKSGNKADKIERLRAEGGDE